MNRLGPYPSNWGRFPEWIEKLVCFAIIPLLSDLLVVLGKVSLVPSCPHAFVYSIINWDQREAFCLETFKLHLLATQLVTWGRSVLCVVVCISFPLTKYDFPLDFWISFHLLTLWIFTWWWCSFMRFCLWSTLNACKCSCRRHSRVKCAFAHRRHSRLVDALVDDIHLSLFPKAFVSTT